MLEVSDNLKVEIQKRVKSQSLSSISEEPLVYGRAIKAKRKPPEMNKSLNNDKPVFDQSEDVIFKRFEVKLDDIKRVAVCDFGLSTEASPKIPRGCTPSFMNPLAYTSEFEISKDRFSLAVYTLSLLWRDQYLLAYIPITKRSDIDDFRMRIAEQDDIFKTLFKLLHETQNTNIDLSVLINKFPVNKAGLQRSSRLLASLKRLVRSEFESRFPQNENTDDKAYENFISQKLQRSDFYVNYSRF